MAHLSVAAAPGSPAGRWGGFAPRHRSSRPQGGGRAAGGRGPPPAAPLCRRSWPARLRCSLPPPPHGLSAPTHTHITAGLSAPDQRGFSCCVWFAHRWDVGLVRGTVIVGHEGVELQGVQLEAGVVDVLDILHGVFVHGQQGGGLGGTESIIYSVADTDLARFHGYPPSYLHDTTEVAVSGELQALLFGPGLDVAELLPEYGPPVVAAEP